MKKVLAAALLCTVSAFATWDYFPVKEAGKGESKVGVEYGMAGDVSKFGINAKARFSVIEGLEVAALWGGPGYLLMNDIDGVDGATGVQQPLVGVRYWLPMGLGFFVDASLPVSGEELEGETYLSFKPGVQFSTKLTEELVLGSEAGVYIGLENEVGIVKTTPGMDLDLGLELDYSIGAVTPYVAVNVLVGLTKTKAKTETTFLGTTTTTTVETDKGLGITPSVGVIYAINETLAADAGVSFGIGEDRFGKDMPITINANVAVSF
ncbi:MAG: transporter [Candidatus Fibromonas sp.]|nr:transporter [Candidatus Fibromonas sp.]